MSTILPDGSVVPSYISSRKTMTSGANTSMFGNVALRVGEVTEIFYPEDTRNHSKQTVEYTVSVQQMDHNSWATVDYPSCIVMNLFGGLGDKLRYTARAREKNLVPDTGLGNGSLVLLLCVNGATNRAVIIGGFQRDKDLPETKADGHNLHFNFNGMDAKINKDGEFSLAFGGATNADGVPLDSVQKDAIGGSLVFAKNGNITITDATGAQSIQIDHNNKKVIINGSSEMDITVASGNVKILSNGVLVGDATDAWVKGTTYRQNEAQMNQKLSAALTTMNLALTAAAAALQTMSGALAAGIAGNMPAAPSAALAGIQIQIAAAQAAQMQAALTQFEAGASSYLSTKNKTD